MNKYLWSVLSLLAAVSLHSCSLLHNFPGKKKDISAAGAAVNVPDTARHWVLLPAPDTLGKAPDTTGLMKQLVDKVLPIFNSRIRYRTFSTKAKVHFEGPDDKQDFTANIRLKKDTAMWVDITALGGMFHAARIYITPDSIFMINYSQKTGTRLPLSEVAKILPTQVDFMSLQHLVTGEPLRGGYIKDVAVLGSSWLLQVQDDSYKQTIEYRKADSALLNDIVTTLALNGPQAVLRYDNFEPSNDKKIATSRSVNVQNGADKFLLEMELEHTEFDKELEMPFSIPKSFTVK